METEHRAAGATEYTTRGGLRVCCDAEPLPYPYALTPLAEALDERRGLLLASSCDVPGRYARQTSRAQTRFGYGRRTRLRR